WSFSHGDLQLGGRAAAQRAQRHLTPDAIADEQIEQLFRRLDRVAVELEQHVADEHPGRRRRTAAGHADDQERLFPARTSLRALLIFGQRDRLARDAEISALELSVLEERCGGLP